MLAETLAYSATTNLGHQKFQKHMKKQDLPSVPTTTICWSLKITISDHGVDGRWRGILHKKNATSFLALTLSNQSNVWSLILCISNQVLVVKQYKTINGPNPLPTILWSMIVSYSNHVDWSIKLWSMEPNFFVVHIAMARIRRESKVTIPKQHQA